MFWLYCHFEINFQLFAIKHLSVYHVYSHCVIFWSIVII
jgi:hypothetical protein